MLTLMNQMQLDGLRADLAGEVLALVEKLDAVAQEPGDDPEKPLLAMNRLGVEGMRDMLARVVVLLLATEPPNGVDAPGGVH